MKTLGSRAFVGFTSTCRSQVQRSSHRKLPNIKSGTSALLYFGLDVLPKPPSSNLICRPERAIFLPYFKPNYMNLYRILDKTKYVKLRTGYEKHLGWNSNSFLHIFISWMTVHGRNLGRNWDKLLWSTNSPQSHTLVQTNLVECILSTKWV